jgi:hypothetical protein
MEIKTDNREVGYVCNNCDSSFFYTEDQDERWDGFTSLMGDEWFCPNCKKQSGVCVQKADMESLEREVE